MLQFGKFRTNFRSNFALLDIINQINGFQDHFEKSSVNIRKHTFPAICFQLQK